MLICLSCAKFEKKETFGRRYLGRCHADGLLVQICEPKGVCDHHEPSPDAKKHIDEYKEWLRTHPPVEYVLTESEPKEEPAKTKAAKRRKKP